jgi:hypothetical protein
LMNCTHDLKKTKNLEKARWQTDKEFAIFF